MTNEELNTIYGKAFAAGNHTTALRAVYDANVVKIPIVAEPEPEVIPDFSSMTKAELRAFLTSKGVPTHSTDDKEAMERLSRKASK